MTNRRQVTECQLDIQEKPIVITNRFLVIGKTGNGKSSLCNALLGRRQFEIACSMSSNTLQMQYADTDRDGFRYKVVDTPDVTNSDLTESEIEQEVLTWKTETSPYPSVVLLTVRCDVRYTAEEYAVYREFLRLWGDNSVKSKLAVAFTFGDRQDGDIKEELKTVCPELQNVLSDAGGRYVVFNDMAGDTDKKAFWERVKELATRMEIKTQKRNRNFWLLLILLTLILLGLSVCSYVLEYAFDLEQASVGFGTVGVLLALAILVGVFVKKIYQSKNIYRLNHAA